MFNEYKAITKKNETSFAELNTILAICCQNGWNSNLVKHKFSILTIYKQTTYMLMLHHGQINNMKGSKLNWGCIAL